MSFLHAREATSERRLDLDNAVGGVSIVSEQAAPIFRTHCSMTSWQILFRSARSLPELLSALGSW